MAIRFNCPSCKSINTVSDDKRGKQVRCESCEKLLGVPAAAGKKKRDADESIQEERRVKTRATTLARKPVDAEDDSDHRPSKSSPTKKNAKPTKKAVPILLLVAGAGVLGVLFLFVAAVGLGAYFLLRSKPTVIEPPALAMLEPENGKKDDKEKQDPLNPGPKTDPRPKIDPEPKVDPQPKIDPEPKTDPELPRGKKEKKNDLPREPDPTPPTEPLTPELQRVKQATVQVLTLRPDGKWLEGSGFFVQPGVIVTNAHVLGMLDPKAPPPNGLKVIINGGEPNEKELGAGHTIDRATDLAILRVPGFNLPAPLTFEDPNLLAPNQKVHVVGYPFERKIRKSPTVNATEIANLKKDGTGALEEIQVNGGMSPGSSGGPVVTPEGKVIGVALGGVNDMPIHLAVPMETVKRMLDGKVGELTFGKPRPFGDKMVVDTTVSLIDPLLRIKEARVEVWTGLPTPGRPYSYKQPAQLPVDSERTAHKLLRQGTFATHGLVPPSAIPPGLVLWVQPVIVCMDGTTQWGVAAVLPMPTTAYDRRPVNLTANFQTPKDRTVKLKYTLSAKTKKGAIAVRTDFDMLEVMTAQPDGGQMRAAYGTINILGEFNGQKFPMPKPLIDLLRTVPTAYGFDPFNKVKSRDHRPLAPDVPKDQGEQVLEQLYQIGTTYEATLMPLPNREVQPGETWATTVPILFREKQKTAILPLALNNTFEGVLTKGARRDAIISVTGKLRALEPEFKDFEADVTGKFGFDVLGGFISFAQLKFTSTSSSAEQESYTLDIDLDRSAGNTGNLKLLADAKQPPDPKTNPKGEAKILFQQAGVLTAADPIDPATFKPKSKTLPHRMKVYRIPMQAGKTYTISLTSTTFDSVLRLDTPTGMRLAENNNGGGAKNARIVHRPTVTGIYVVIATCKDGKLGPFQLSITESP